ncbi:hypothetical protein KBP30_41220 [Streptomyces sp. Go40/10]|uniref:hypothetical protein n=1 Tax=Streptomyces sp. Go40/10 TaxID=2825844 RepID=UPI001E42195E|nr:hypothetical protein [Streptomyces sp. Go40/10]UFR07161.1 hypothetical protein KBP30_41220 [Streptomyces sp. Go40/10]
MAFLESLPYAAGHQLNLDFAACLVAACRAGCRPCQATLARKVIADHRPTLAVLAGAVYGLELNADAQHSLTVSDATRSWSPLARAAAESGDGTAAFTAVEEMDEARAAELLEDALDHWAAGGVDPDVLRTLDLDTQDNITAWTHSGGAAPGPFAGTETGLPDDLVDVPRYAVLLATTSTPDGRQLPMLTLECETAGAGLADLSRRTGWQAWNARTLPELDVDWRLRVDIASKLLQSIVRVQPDGWDEEPHLWDASETVTLPETFWNLLDRAQHVLVAGPVTDAENESEVQRAAEAGELLAAVARVSFN